MLCAQITAHWATLLQLLVVESARTLTLPDTREHARVTSSLQPSTRHTQQKDSHGDIRRRHRRPATLDLPGYSSSLAVDDDASCKSMPDDTHVHKSVSIPTRGYSQAAII